VKHVFTQTTLTLPPILPSHVEQVLRQYCNFQEPSGPSSHSSFSEEPCNLSNSTLRRKLFNGDMLSDDSSSSSESCSGSPPLSPLTPGKVLHTPVTARSGGTSQWSSSPVRGPGRTVSFSPPDQMGSPMFSPIVKEKGRVVARESQGSEDGNLSMVEGIKVNMTTCVSPGEVELSRVEEMSQEMAEEEAEEVEELYKTAEVEVSSSTGGQSSQVQMEVDRSVSMVAQPATVAAGGAQDTDTWPSSADTWGASHSERADTWASSADTWGASHSERADTWGVSHSGPVDSTRADTWSASHSERADTWGASHSGAVDTTRADTGYSTNPSVNSSLEPPSGCYSRQDSGVAVSLSQQEQSSKAISELRPPEAIQPTSGVLLSYGATDTTNDISVGFPLGSSTPTKD